MKKHDKNKILYEHRKKTPWIAGFLSLIFVGTGSMYAGKVSKGFTLLAISMLLWVVLLGWIVWIIAPYIAIQDAKKYNEMLKMELDL